MNTAYPLEEIRLPERTPEPFRQILTNHGLVLSRKKTTTLQINVGLLCNQRCRHCHLSAGPDRRENMDSETVDAVIAYAERSRFEAIDITGGAPELNPNIVKLIEGLFPHAPRLSFRSNLSVLSDGKRDDLIKLLKDKSVGIIASFPSLNEAQADAQRGDGIFQRSLDSLLKLNALGYGNPETGLTLDLVSNPAGAFLPGSQGPLEKRFREVLLKKWGVVFNNLFAFANAPLGRFRNWLDENGNLETYLENLASGFNACTVEGLMCRSLVSVSWDGVLHDCDFNLSLGLHLGTQRTHVCEMPGPPEEGLPIAVGDHCYTCTAGAGFT
ncbi:MAG: arsenosugar biosynthesis radical SAM protein ArsS [Proteobacteria bacterium]|nr:arsenosugar biosynthesis radical SAM protein ArsS [Pseudomonadota bacterium]MBU4472451.1 arsenosugar biosynthesis radical SAM protein ArsS [Pseudomonadota bacterium]MCG2751278.1 arsenosugar biosynthesis radical SAM protein ArsS [Desulfobacteraceae bacterium]